jgi:hypothetical protein
VVKRRMKASKFEEVGHIRSRSGISMKMRMKPDTLGGSSAASLQTAGFMIKIAHMSIMLKMIRRLKWKILAMPSANARSMQSTPVLDA